MIVERWNGIPFVEPYKKVRDVVRFLRDALSGEKVTKQYDTFEVNGFKLGVRPEQTPPILVAALREGMLRLAAREGDGAIINWLSADDVRKVVGVVNDAAGGEPKEIVCRIFCCPSENADAVRAAAKFAIAAYLNVPVYAQFHDWLGRGDGAAADVGRLEGRRPQGGAGGDPRLAGGRAGGARLAGRVPGHDPALLRQRRDAPRRWRSCRSTRT